jgi:lysophospholipase L1-like esterase
MLYSLKSLLAEPGCLQAITVQVCVLALVYYLVKKLNAGLAFRAGFAILSACVILLEVLLRLTGVYATYIEKKSGRYESYYKYRPQQAVHKRTPGETISLASPGEFSYDYVMNSWGYNDVEWDTAAPDSVFRILVLGDSFTEGFGAPQDSSWAAQLRDIMRNDIFFQQLRVSVEVLQAGISAADPYANLFALKEELHALKPDLVVQIISNQDFEEDFRLRGGMERFTPDGKLKYRVEPTAEWLYAYSHLSRVIFYRVFGYNQYLQKELSEWEKMDFTLCHLQALTSAYETWADSSGTKCLLLFMDTDAYQIAKQKTIYWESYLQLESEQVSAYSIVPCLHKHYLTDTMNFSQYWWQNDGHHNNRGYRLMAECIYPRVKAHIPIKESYVLDCSNPDEIPVRAAIDHQQ